MSAAASERAKEAWADGKYAHLKDLWTPERRAAQAERVRAISPMGADALRIKINEAALRRFAALVPRPPWKVLAHQLNTSEQTLSRWRKTLGLVTEPAKSALTPEVEKRIEEHDTRIPWSVLARELGVGAGVLARWRKKKAPGEGRLEGGIDA